jgi:hypothetical protein
MARTLRDSSYEYQPDTWTPSQLAMHRATSIDKAFEHAGCLAGGWYCRPVTIDYQVTPENTETYMIRPSEVPVLEGWTPCYTVTAHNG